MADDEQLDEEAEAPAPTSGFDAAADSPEKQPAAEEEPAGESAVEEPAAEEDAAPEQPADGPAEDAAEEAAEEAAADEYSAPVDAEPAEPEAEPAAAEEENGADEDEAATKVQAVIRGQQARKATAASSSAEPAAEDAYVEEQEAAEQQINEQADALVQEAAEPAPKPPRVQPPTVFHPQVDLSVRRTRTLPILDLARKGFDGTDGHECLGEYGSLEAVVNVTNPRTLWLNDNVLDQNVSPFLGEILSSRPEVCRIKRLNLTGNQLGDAGVATLLGALDKAAAAEIVALGLGVNQLTDVALKTVAIAISAGGSLTSLAELRLGGNPFGVSGAKALAAALCSEGGAGATTLTMLQMGATNIGDEGGEALARALIAEGDDNSDEIFGLAEEGGENAEDEENFVQIIRPEGPSALTSLHLADCGLGERSAAAFSKMLTSSRIPMLKELWLGGNPLTAEGGALICEVLEFAPQVEKLWLDRVGLDDTAAFHIVKNMTDPESRLTELWVGGNELTDASAEEIAGALGQPVIRTQPLRKLWMDHCDGVSAAGAQALVQAAAPRSRVEDEPAWYQGQIVPTGGEALHMLWVGGKQIWHEEKKSLEEMAEIDEVWMAAVADKTEEAEGDEYEAAKWAVEERGGGPLRLLVDEPTVKDSDDPSKVFDFYMAVGMPELKELEGMSEEELAAFRKKNLQSASEEGAAEGLMSEFNDVMAREVEEAEASGTFGEGGLLLGGASATEEDEAATKVQAVIRGQQARREMVAAAEAEYGAEEEAEAEGEEAEESPLMNELDEVMQGDPSGSVPLEAAGGLVGDEADAEQAEAEPEGDDLEAGRFD